MNSVGRHYRDQSDPTQPYCDYELGGAKCTFFTTPHEFSSIPYPTDITTGPATDSVASPPSSSDISELISLLKSQKADQDSQRVLQQEQAEQMRLLQKQVSSLAHRESATVSTPPSFPATIPVVLSTTTVTTTTSSPLPTFTTASAPQVVTNAAASLSASLQSGLGQNNGTYSGLTMEHLRANPQLVSQATAVLANATQHVPPLNPSPLEGMGNSLRGGQSNQVINSVDQLYRVTTLNKQLRNFEFAGTGQFAYRSQLTRDNCNVVCFAYGAMKHLEACKSGLIQVSDAEFLARLRHLKNVFEISALSSKLDSYSEQSWLVAREYDSRVISDIEAGGKSWESLSGGIEPDSIYCAKETVENRQKLKKAPKIDKDRKSGDEKKIKKLCTTYNTHRSSEGCYWEHQNQGQSCVFDHYCTWCKQNRNVAEKHKLSACEHKTE